MAENNNSLIPPFESHDHVITEPLPQQEQPMQQPGRETVIRDNKGNELRVSQTENPQVLTFNYEELTAETSNVGGVQGFKVWEPAAKRPKRPRAEQSEHAPRPKPAEPFNPKKFGEKLPVIAEESLEPGIVYVRNNPENETELQVVVGGPKSRVQATATPSGGVNLKMRRHDKKLVRVGWTAEQVTAMRGRTETTADAEMPVTDEPITEEIVAVVDEVMEPAGVAEAEDATAPMQQERLRKKTGGVLRKILPTVALIGTLAASVFASGVGLPTDTPHAAAVPMHTVGQVHHTTPHSPATSGGLGGGTLAPPTMEYTIQSGDNLFNLSEHQIEIANPSLSGPQLEDETKALMLVQEDLNNTVTNWRDLHPGETIKLYNENDVSLLVQTLDHKPGRRAPADIKQNWQNLNTAWNVLMNVQGTHDQEDFGQLLQKPDVANAISTINHFLEGN